MHSFFELVRLSCKTIWVRDSRFQVPFWRRVLLFLFLLIVFLPWQFCNRIALALDHLLFNFCDIEPTEAIFVTGVPRSGTTMLHRLLANDQPNLTTFHLWELLFAPAIIQKRILLGLSRIDHWVGAPFFRCLKMAERLLFGKLDNIHGTSLTDPEEDYLALIPYCGCFLLVQLFPFSNRIWNLVQMSSTTDSATSLRRELIPTYRSLVQRHLYVFGPDKAFLSKNPAFTTWTQDLLEAFPTGKVLACHRDPRQAIPSLLSSMESGTSLLGNEDNIELQQQFVAMMAGFYRTIFREQANSSRFRAIPFSQLTTAPWELLKSTCSELGINSVVFTEKLEKDCQTATNYKSQHQYETGQFGLEIDRIRLELKEYSDEHPIESSTTPEPGG